MSRFATTLLQIEAGAACATKRGFGPGTPYFEDSSEAFRLALTKFDFEPVAEPTSKESAIDVVLREARARDVMTLWYLLSRVNNNERARVYDRMTALVAPPEGVTRQGILKLDQSMLDRWKVKLGLSWDEVMQPKHSVWKKLWKETLGRLNGLQEKR